MPDVMLADFVAEAARSALENAEVNVDEIDLLILATSSHHLRHVLYKKRSVIIMPFCFRYCGNMFWFSLRPPDCRQSDGYSWLPQGSGAMVFSLSEDGRGLLGTSLKSDGRCHHLLNVPGYNRSNLQTDENLQEHRYALRLGGQEALRHAVVSMTKP